MSVQLFTELEAFMVSRLQNNLLSYWIICTNNY